MPRSAKRVMGIEPTSVAWKATALPLSYTRVDAMFKTHDQSPNDRKTASVLLLVI